MCLEQGPLQTHSSLGDSECLSNGGIRQNTTPTPEGPLKESENSYLENETSQSLRFGFGLISVLRPFDTF